MRCAQGIRCKDFHPQMCPESLYTKTCSKIKGAKRCPKGYHINGTKDSSKAADGNSDSGKKSEMNEDISKEQINSRVKELELMLEAEKSKNKDNLSEMPAANDKPSSKEELRSFFGEILWEKVFRLIRTEITNQMGGMKHTQSHQPSHLKQGGPCCHSA